MDYSLADKKSQIRDLVEGLFECADISENSVAERMSYFGNFYSKSKNWDSTPYLGLNDKVQKIISEDEDFNDEEFSNNKHFLDSSLDKKDAKMTYTSDLQYLRFYAETVVFNKLLEDLVDVVDKKDTFILLPHCLRPRKECKASENSTYDICVECYKCDIGIDFVKIAREKGSDTNKIAIEGGREAVIPILTNTKSKAIIGMACSQDLRTFMSYYMDGARDGVSLPPAKMLLLSSLGCKNTSYDSNDVKLVLTQNIKEQHVKKESSLENWS